MASSLLEKLLFQDYQMERLVEDHLNGFNCVLFSSCDARVEYWLEAPVFGFLQIHGQ